MGRNLGVVVNLGIAFVLLLSINLIAAMVVGNAKVDMTEENLYTLSGGSKDLLGKLDDKVRLKLFYSTRAANNLPVLKNYADRVIELLRQYEGASGGKVILELLEPRPDTEIEEWAIKYGLKALPTGTENVYFGLAIVSEVGKEESIPFLDPSREQFLEYDISRMIYSVSAAKKNVVGIMSSLDVMGGFGADPMARLQGRRPNSPWIFVQELKRLYDVKEVSMTADEIDPEINLLLVIHPKNITPKAEYAIDQYLLKGGRVIVLVDPLCVYEQINFNSPDPNQRFQASFDSNLPTLFKAWGIEMPAGKVAGDVNIATPIGQDRKQHPAFLTLGAKNCNQQEIISSNLENLNYVLGGILKKKEGAPYKITPLLETTDQGGEIDAFLLKFSGDADQIRRDFKPGTEKIPLAVKIAGKFQTAFPAGDPAPKPAEGPGDEGKKPAHVPRADQETTVMVLADVDMIADDFSVRKQQVLNQVLAMSINDNLNFVNNAVENLMGSQELIALRTRGKSRRPFDRVNDLERKAQERFKAEEDSLNARKEATEQKLNDLQRGKDANQRAVLSDEQVREMDKFREELASTKQGLREVRRKLREDIERLGAVLKFLNIALMPVLVLLAGFLPTAWRSYKMRTSHHG